MSDTRLDEYDKSEWATIYRAFKPEAAEQEYDAAWERFVAAKAEHIRQQGLN